MSSYKFTQRAVASPDAPLKPLVRKRARSGGENWVRVTRQPDSRAKKPRTGGSQQPACAHTEHDILSTTEAAAFAAQFWCVSCLVQLCAQNCDHPPPPTHTFLKRRFPTDFEKHTHTPPKVTTFWCITPKVEKSLKKCENAPCWHRTDVPERYVCMFYVFMISMFMVFILIYQFLSVLIKSACLSISSLLCTVQAR